MKYDGIIKEILYYGEKNKDGKWIIPIGVDWDYTLTKCSSWENGTMDVNYDALKIMKRWAKEYNVGWILDTMRPDSLLKEPLKILSENNVIMYGIRRNPTQDKNDPKIFSIMTIDDKCLGIPLNMADGCDRPHVDWNGVEKIAEPILSYINDKINS